MGRGLRPGRRSSTRRRPSEEAAEVARGEGVEGDGVRRRLRLDHRPGGVRRARRCPPTYERAYREARGRATRSRARRPFGIGLGMVAPTILAHAIPEVRERVPAPAVPRRHRRLPAVLRAGRRLRPRRHPDPAVRDGDEWILTGQKVWTSGAQYSDIGEIITRTSPDKPKHKGLTMFVVDMKAPGRRGAPAAPDDRRRVVQRGVLRRGARATTRTGSATSTRAGRSRSRR